MVEHVNITDPNIHEPKGIASASNGQVYVADGAGSGDWTTYNWHGWGFYEDSGSGTQTFTTTASLIQLDAGAAATEESYLPLSIRGSGSLWDGTNDHLTPIATGDVYTIRLDLPVTATSGTPTIITVTVDQGGLSSISDTITSVNVPVDTAPYTISLEKSIQILSTAKSNGVQLFIATDTGDISVDNPSILITRLSAGDL